ncbi:uncharacterized protein AB9X84_007237 isoform 1-T1 [Acanthopagrus schlegelii]
MSEDLYAKPDLTKKVRFQAGEKKDGNTDVGENIDNVTIYDNSWAEGSAAPKSEDDTSDHQQPSAGDVKRSPCRAAAVILGLLCLLLLTGLIALVVIYTKGTSEWKMEMVLAHIHINNLTKERDQLQTSYNNLTEERDQLQTNYNNLTKERDQLQISYNNLTEEQEQLQNRFDNVAKERENLHRMFREGWRYANGSVYYRSSERKSWQESRDDCQQRGADLVIINSTEEQQFLRSLNVRTWIGLTDNSTEGIWKWVNGMKAEAVFWANTQPDNRGPDGTEENCAEIHTDFNSIHNWNDNTCSYPLNFICEKMLQ